MKSLCGLFRSTRRPSTDLPATVAGGSNSNVLSILDLLPPAVSALASPLAPDDKEVMAYLMLLSINEWGSESEKQRGNCRKVEGAHPPSFDCVCFACYTSYWMRSDSSNHRESTHLAIEGFESHLGSKERKKREEEEDEEKQMVECRFVRDYNHWYHHWEHRERSWNERK